jgi:hypothetical protein
MLYIINIKKLIWLLKYNIFLQNPPISLRTSSVLEGKFGLFYNTTIVYKIINEHYYIRLNF